MSSQTTSLIKMNARNLRSLYKLYYTRKLDKNIKAATLTSTDKQVTSFILYGTINNLSPVERRAFNQRMANSNTNDITVDFSVIPYSNFKVILKFSQRHQFKSIIKGGMFYQVKIDINFDSSEGLYSEKQRLKYKSITTWFDLFRSSDFKKDKSTVIFPSIIIAHTTSDLVIPIRYSTFCSFRKNHEIIDYSQIGVDLIAVILYKQSSITTEKLAG
jgi:hypothetical protein